MCMFVCHERLVVAAKKCSTCGTSHCQRRRSPPSFPEAEMEGGSGSTESWWPCHHGHRHPSLGSHLWRRSEELQHLAGAPSSAGGRRSRAPARCSPASQGRSWWKAPWGEEGRKRLRGHGRKSSWRWWHHICSCGAPCTRPNLPAPMEKDRDKDWWGTDHLPWEAVGEKRAAYTERREAWWITGFHSELMHDPVGLLPLGSSSMVEHERLPHAHHRPPPLHLPVLPGGLPVSGHGGAVGPLPRRVLAIPQVVEVPHLAAHTCHLCNNGKNPCNSFNNKKKKRRRRRFCYWGDGMSQLTWKIHLRCIHSMDYCGGVDAMM